MANMAASTAITIPLLGWTVWGGCGRFCSSSSLSWDWTLKGRERSMVNIIRKCFLKGLNLRVLDIFWSGDVTILVFLFLNKHLWDEIRNGCFNFVLFYYNRPYPACFLLFVVFCGACLGQLIRISSGWWRQKHASAWSPLCDWKNVFMIHILYNPYMLFAFMENIFLTDQ